MTREEKRERRQTFEKAAKITRNYHPSVYRMTQAEKALLKAVDNYGMIISHDFKVAEELEKEAYLRLTKAYISILKRA